MRSCTASYYCLYYSLLSPVLPTCVNSQGFKGCSGVLVQLLGVFCSSSRSHHSSALVIRCLILVFNFRSFILPSTKGVRSEIIRQAIWFDSFMVLLCQYLQLPVWQQALLFGSYQQDGPALFWPQIRNALFNNFCRSTLKANVFRSLTYLWQAGKLQVWGNSI